MQRTILQGKGGKMVVETRNPEETFALGEKIGRTALPGQIYTLTGDLGVGKNSADSGGCRRAGDPGGGEQPHIYNRAGV